MATDDAGFLPGATPCEPERPEWSAREAINGLAELHDLIRTDGPETDQGEPLDRKYLELQNRLHAQPLKNVTDPEVTELVELARTCIAAAFTTRSVAPEFTRTPGYECIRRQRPWANPAHVYGLVVGLLGELFAPSRKERADWVCRWIKTHVLCFANNSRGGVSGYGVHPAFSNAADAARLLCRAVGISESELAEHLMEWEHRYMSSDPNKFAREVAAAPLEATGPENWAVKPEPSRLGEFVQEVAAAPQATTEPEDSEAEKLRQRRWITAVCQELALENQRRKVVSQFIASLQGVMLWDTFPSRGQADTAPEPPRWPSRSS